LSSMKGQGPSSLACWLKIFLRPKTQTPDVPQPSDVSQDFAVIIPCRTLAADSRPYPRLVDPAAVTLPLHSTPMDEVPDVRGSLGTQYVSPVFGKLPHTAGQTPPPTQAACSLHIYRTKISNRSLVSVSGLSIRVDFLDQCKTVRSIKSNQIKSNR